jgi:hypothetical protein
MLIWLASYPRSGNTFCRVLLHRLYGVPTYSVYPEPDWGPVADIIAHQELPASLEEMAADRQTYIVKTHDLPGNDDYPAIYLVRDGRDAVVSYARYILAFRVHDDIPKTEELFRDRLRKLIEKGNPTGGEWSANVKGWSRRPNTVVVKFEELVKEPVETVQRAINGTACALNETSAPNRIPDFAELKQLMPEFFRRGQIGAWKSEMPPDLHTLFWDCCGDVMLELGYER